MVIIGFIGVYLYMDKLNEINGLSVSTPQEIMIFNFTALAEISGMIVLALWPLPFSILSTKNGIMNNS